jgi:hypothetical protein
MRAKRMLVLTEPGRSGDAALREAGELAGAGATGVTLVGVAPQASGPRCGVSIGDYNVAVIASVAEDLARARARLEGAGVAASSRLLVEGRAPSLEQFAADGDFDLLLLPSRRSVLGRTRHPAAEKLRASTRADVRLVGAREGRSPE